MPIDMGTILSVDMCGRQCATRLGTGARNTSSTVSLTRTRIAVQGMKVRRISYECETSILR
jgi:hypothetical protein